MKRIPNYMAPIATLLAFLFLVFGDDHGAVMFLIVSNIFLYTRGPLRPPLRAVT